MTEEQSSYLGILASMLGSLAESRRKNDAWKDAEKDVPGTQAFKIGEALRPFYLLAAHDFDPPINIPIEKRHLVQDTIAFFSAIHKDGFFPSPYSTVVSTDQYTDFASFALELADLVLRYPESATLSDTEIKEPARACIRKALDFLTSPTIYLEDADGVRWAGTSTRSRLVKKVTEYFTDTYFTANVVLALSRALDFKTVSLAQERREHITNLIRKAGQWIADREKHSLLTGDEERKDEQFFYTTWGIRALSETYHIQSPTVRARLKAVAATYVDTLRQSLDTDGEPSVTQDYIRVCSPEFGTVSEYEERTGWAGVLLALTSLARIRDLEATLEASQFKLVLDEVLSGLRRLGDPVSNLWYQGYFIISIHSSLAEAFMGIRRHAASPWLRLPTHCGGRGQDCAGGT